MATHEAAHRIGQVPDGFGKDLCTKKLHTPLIHPVLLPVFHLHEGHEKRNPSAPLPESEGGAFHVLHVGGKQVIGRGG